MKSITALIFYILLAITAHAGLPYQATLEEMAEQAEHILVGEVVGVDMVDKNGQPVTERSATTGPGIGNTIRLLIAVDEVLVTNARKVPTILAVPLANHLHYSLGQISDAHEDDYIKRLVLLKGENFSGIKPGVFFRPLDDKEEALWIYHATH